MGMDLKLLPIRSRGSDVWFVHDGLRMERDTAIFEQIASAHFPTDEGQVPTYPIGPLARVTFAEDPKDREYSLDAYRRPLTYALARDLVQCVIMGTTAPWNRAIWAFLAALPGDTVVVLWWC
jgi:hypothetical protein